MYAIKAISALATSQAIPTDGNTIGGVNVATVITGGTGDIVVEATLADVAGSDYASAAWMPIATFTAGTDDLVMTNIPGPVSAIRLNGAALTAGTAAIEVRQAVRV